MKPCSLNSCAGIYSDWLEVMYTWKCNGICSWCIEKNGYHPPYDTKLASYELAQKILERDYKNVVVLGGEPTLRVDLVDFIGELALHDINVYVTTNGSMLSRRYAWYNLRDIRGLNISIHDYNLDVNAEITGINLEIENLIEAIEIVYDVGATIRLNCNCIKDSIDSKDQCYEYIKFAKEIGATHVRFAELKNDDDNFVDLAEVFDFEYGLNLSPFYHGCNRDVVIDGMKVNFRQMCGLQTNMRETPEDPEQIVNPVLYYDGNYYNGWQLTERKEIVTDKELIDILESVKSKEMSIGEAALKIGRKMNKVKIEEVSTDGIGCTY